MVFLVIETYVHCLTSFQQNFNNKKTRAVTECNLIPPPAL